MTGTSNVFVIGGYTFPGERTGIGGLLLGHHDDGALRYAGVVEEGFTAQDRRSLRTDLEQHLRETPPFVDPPSLEARWVEPIETCRVEFRRWDRDGLLVEPVFRGLRDVPPEEVRPEHPARYR